MTDYGHDIRLGIFPTPDAAAPHRAVELEKVLDGDRARRPALAAV